MRASNTIHCDSFELLLDAHGPDDLPADAVAHAATCARCARALAAARSIESLLIAPTAVPAPSGFTDRVLARIRTAPVTAPAIVSARVPALFDPLPQWIRCIAEPATAGALVIASLVVWQAPRLLAMARVLGSAVAARAAGESVTVDPSLWPSAMSTALGNDAVRLALVVTGSSLAPLVAFLLYRWSERLAAGGMRRR